MAAMALIKMWYRLETGIAENRDFSSIIHYALMCYTGEGGHKDFAEAVRWLEKASELSLLYTDSDYEQQTLSPYYLGNIYNLGGYGVEPDKQKATEWYEKASKNIPAANYMLGLMALEGQKGKADYKKAHKWFLKAANQGDTDAQYELGLMYLKGENIVQDYQVARKWFSSAASKGNEDAEFYLGHLYVTGKGVQKNYPEAIRWFSKLAERGDQQTQLFLGELYQEGGNGLTKNYTQAHKWFNICASQGNDRAKTYRDSLSRKMTIAQTSEAQRLARIWKPKK
jgi:TPR repeat protein